MSYGAINIYVYAYVGQVLSVEPYVARLCCNMTRVHDATSGHVKESLVALVGVAGMGLYVTADAVQAA